MTAIATPQVRFSYADVAPLSDRDGKLYLDAGVLVEKRLSTRANEIAAEIAFLLKSAYPRSTAFVFVEQPTYCFADRTHMRRPDVALVWAARMPAGTNDPELFIPPDLVVEAVSPTNTFDQQLERVFEYLEAGVPLVWVVQPAIRLLHVYRRDGSVAVFRAGATLNDALLPGLSLEVGKVFPPVGAAAVT